MIIERIRWDSVIRAHDGDFKINNSHAPFYSRLFVMDFPEHKDFFRFRKSKADDEDLEDIFVSPIKRVLNVTAPIVVGGRVVQPPIDEDERENS